MEGICNESSFRLEKEGGVGVKKTSLSKNERTEEKQQNDRVDAEVSG